MSISTIANGDGSRICRLSQSGYIVPPDGALPTAPTWNTMRLDRFGLDIKQTVRDSEEMNPDRKFRGTYRTAIDVVGGLGGGLIYSEHDTLLLDGLHSSGWSSNQAVIGSVRRWALYEETMELGVTDLYKRFVNTLVNKMTLTFPSDGKAMIEQELVGTHLLTDDAEIADSVYAAQSYSALPGTVESIYNETQSGLPTGADPLIESVKITIDHNLERRAYWRSPYSLGFRRGRAKVDIEIKCYADTAKLYQAAVERSTLNFRFDWGGESGSRYQFYLANNEIVQVTTDERSSGKDSMITLLARAKLTASEPIVIKRAVT